MKRYVYQAIAYGLFAAGIASFSAWPSWRLLADDEAIISISFSHAAQRIGECRRLTQEEMNELPPNMRRPDECPRERHPVHLVLSANDDVLLDAVLPPSGLWKDGKANVYHRIRVPAGDYRFRIAISDSGRSAGFDHERTATVEIAPGENLVIGFDGTSGAFLFGAEEQ